MVIQTFRFNYKVNVQNARLIMQDVKLTKMQNTWEVKEVKMQKLLGRMMSRFI